MRKDEFVLLFFEHDCHRLSPFSDNLHRKGSGVLWCNHGLFLCRYNRYKEDFSIPNCMPHHFFFMRKYVTFVTREKLSLCQWRSEDVRGPWTTDSPGPAPPLSFLYLPFLIFSLSVGARFSSGAPGHCPPMPPTRYATALCNVKKRQVVSPYFENLFY